MADTNNSNAAASSSRPARPKVVQPKPTNKEAVAPHRQSPSPLGHIPSVPATSSLRPAIQSNGPSTNNNGITSAPLHQSRPVVGPKIVSSAGSGSSILAHPQQKGNPVLRELTHQRWEHAEIAPDYHIATSTCALFLSLKYHRLHPEYIHQRIKAISGMYSHRLLLLQHDVDVTSSEPAIRELTKISLVNNLTLLMAWTPAEVAQWLEKYKMCEFKGAEMIRGRIKETQRERMSDVLTQPTGVNKTDATALMARFGSIRAISQATTDDFSEVPGLGEIKVKRLREAFTTPFRIDERRTYRQRKAARLAEEGVSARSSIVDDDSEDVDGQEVLSGLGRTDNGAGSRPKERTTIPPGGHFHIPSSEFGGIDEDEFPLNEEELAMLEQQASGPRGDSSKEKAGQQQYRDVTPRQTSRAMDDQVLIGTQQSDEYAHLLLDGDDYSALDDVLDEVSARNAKSAVAMMGEKEKDQEEEEEEAVGEGEEEDAMQGLTEEERIELRAAMEMSLAGGD